MLNISQLESLYNHIGKKNELGFVKYVYFNGFVSPGDYFKSFKWDINFLNELQTLNIIRDIIDDERGRMEQSFYIDISKVEFILGYEKAIKKNSDIEDVIDKINKIGFERFYNEILLDGEYKIKNIQYFVYYIYVLDDSEKIKILENYVNSYGNSNIENLKVESGKLEIIINYNINELLFIKNGTIVVSLNLIQSDFGKILKYCFENHIFKKKIKELYKCIGKSKTEEDAEKAFRQSKSNFISQNDIKYDIDILINKVEGDKYSLVLNYKVI